MKKVLIISYYFPPGNFAGSFRVKAWAEYLRNSGFYPIVVTRHWSGNETEYTSISAKKEITKEDYPNFIVYRLPYRGGLRDRLIEGFGTKFFWLGKVFSFFQIIGQNYFLRSVPFSNLYHFSREVIKNDPEIKFVIASGRPFVLFRFCNLLKKEFPHLHWVADYRDAWNTASTINDSITRRIQRFFEKSLEKEWVQSASLVTAVSGGIAEEVSAFINKPVEIIYNGFEPTDYSVKIDPQKKELRNTFKIVYSGSIYPWQPLEGFLEAFKVVSKKFGNKLVNELVFVGTNHNKALKEFIHAHHELSIKITPKILREDSLAFQQQADLLLMLGHKGRKGILSSKIFEYLGAGKPIFLSATDDEELTGIVSRTGSGFIARGPIEIQKELEKVFRLYLENGFVPFNPVQEEVAFFTREKQTRRLGEELKKFQG